MVFYNILLTLGAFALSPLLLPVFMASKKRRKTLFKRLGAVALPRNAPKGAFGKASGSPIWVHALSVGEVISAVPLVKALVKAYPHRHVVFSASTFTGFEVARQRIGRDVMEIFYYPYDFIFTVKRITGAVKPALVVLVETDVWPNFLSEMNKNGVPVILVNARLSNRSFRGYRRMKRFGGDLFSNLSRICTQTRTTF